MSGFYPLYVTAALTSQIQEVGMLRLELYDVANNDFGSLEMIDGEVTFKDTGGNVISLGGGGSGDMVLATAQTVTAAKTFNNATLLMRNVANTFSSQFTNTNTAARTYTLPDAAGIIALTSNITGTNSGTNTGDQTITLTGAVTGSGTASFAASLGSFTKSQLDTAISDGNVLYVGDAVASVTVDVEASDVSCFPAFFTAKSGNLAPKTNEGLLYNSATNALTATTFVGALTGNASTVTTNANLTGHVTSTGNAAVLGSFSKAQLDAAVSDGNVLYVGDAPTAHNHSATEITSGTLAVARGGTGLSALGTSLQVLRTNAGATGLEYATITSGSGDALVANPLSQFAATTSAQLAGVISNKTGSELLVFATSPTLTTPNIGAATGTSLSVTGVIATSANGAASTSAVRVSGVPFAGTGTTSFPLVYVADANATASTTLNTAGTYLGVNGDGTQDLMHLLTDGVSRFKVSSTGNIAVANGATLLNTAGTGLKFQDGILSFFTDNTEQLRIRPNADYIRLASYMNVGWSSGSPSSAGPDVQLSRSSAGVLQVGATSTDALGSLLLAGITIGAGTKITKVLSATATLDFGSVAAQSYADLTITVTGAALGDTVSLGVPNASITNDISFFGWVSATNTVTIRCTNISLATARDPASGTFRATITQF